MQTLVMLTEAIFLSSDVNLSPPNMQVAYDYLITAGIPFICVSNVFMASNFFTFIKGHPRPTFPHHFGLIICGNFSLYNAPLQNVHLH